MIDLIIGFIEIGIGVMLIEFNYMFNLGISLLMVGSFYIGKRILSRKGKIVMNEEEKKAIKLLKDIENNSWSTKYIMSSDSKNATIILNLIEKLENMYNKEYNEHMEMKRQNSVLRNNERILREKNKKAKEYVQNLRQYFSEDCQADFGNIIELLEEEK